MRRRSRMWSVAWMMMVMIAMRCRAVPLPGRGCSSACACCGCGCVRREREREQMTTDDDGAAGCSRLWLVRCGDGRRGSVMRAVIYCVAAVALRGVCDCPCWRGGVAYCGVGGVVCFACSRIGSNMRAMSAWCAWCVSDERASIDRIADDPSTDDVDRVRCGPCVAWHVRHAAARRYYVQSRVLLQCCCSSSCALDLKSV